MINYHDVLRAIVEEAGQLVLESFRSSIVARIKDDGSIATPVDEAIEKFLQEKLLAIEPQASFFGEEFGDQSAKNSDLVWVVDPLDGTRNYVHGLPYFCISIALVRQGVPMVGAVFAPVLKDYFYAQQGFGFFINGIPSKLAGAKEYLVPGLLLTGDFDKLAKIKNKLVKPAGAIMSMRKSGSAALDLAYVAAGYIDVAAYGPMKWWDVASGVVMVQQAGGVIFDLSGTWYQQGAPSLVAGPKDLLSSFLANYEAEI